MMQQINNTERKKKKKKQSLLPRVFRVEHGHNYCCIVTRQNVGHDKMNEFFRPTKFCSY